MPSLATIQKHINERIKKIKKRKNIRNISLSPKRKREDLDFIGYILDNKSWKNRQRGNKTKQFDNHL